MSARPPEPHGSDDDFVDVRLRSALRHAPDGDARPPAALRHAVLQAARASLPKSPTWWQRLLDNGPSMQRAWATAAGLGAFGLALNLAWHMTSAPPSDEYTQSPVASVGESVQAPMPSSSPPAAMPDQQAKAAAGAVADAPLPSAPPAERPLARRDAVPTTQASRKAAEPAPAIEAAAPQPVPAPPAAPAPTAPPRPAEVDSEAKKALMKGESARSDRAADMAAQAPSDKAMSDERRRGFAPPGDSARSEDLAAAATPAAAPAPAAEAQARPKPAPSPSTGIAQAPGAEAPAAVPVLPASSAWPQPLARLQQALSGSEDWPSGWTLQGPAEIAVPRRAWWQAMLTGTAGRWQAVQEPGPSSVPGSQTWHVHGTDGTRFTLMLVDGQAWLQSGGNVWRAPWPGLPAPSPR